jgi:hypothetical protein
VGWAFEASLKLVGFYVVAYLCADTRAYCGAKGAKNQTDDPADDATCDGVSCARFLALSARERSACSAVPSTGSLRRKGGLFQVAVYAGRVKVVPVVSSALGPRS